MGNSRQLYIELLKAAVRNTLYVTEPSPPSDAEIGGANELLRGLVEKYGARAPKVDSTTVLRLIQASQLPAHTLANGAQVDNLHHVIEQILEERIPGDFIEAGVFRGGMTILMRGVLKAHLVADRRVFVADSFRGLPSPTKMEDRIAHDVLKHANHFNVSAAEVAATFERYGLLDDQVIFLEGWFRETLPNAPIDKLALIRLDGDYYESTRDAIAALYPKLSKGGFVIVDDYGMPVGCKVAIDEYRALHGITAPLLPVCGPAFPHSSEPAAVYWRA